MQADERITSALARLTDNEKECLRRRLLPQTAKEMAIDLGISAHAVEKRLKMARAKLGLASSLEAARLLSTVEGYGRLGPQPSDLAEAQQTADDFDVAGVSLHRTGLFARRIRPVLLPGVFLMSLFAIGLLALVAQQPATIPTARQLPVIQTSDTPPGNPTKIEDMKLRPASPDEIRTFVADSFTNLDKDGSNFIERSEAPGGIGFGQPHRPGETSTKADKFTWVTGTMGQAMWIANGDTDGDGKVSKDEYMAWMGPIWASHGTLPVDWRPLR